MSWSTRTHAALALVALVTLAGCSGALLGSEDPEEIAEQVQERHDAIEDVHGVQTMSIDGPERGGNMTMEVWESPPDQARQEVLSVAGDLTQADSSGDVVVQNGSTTWYYDSATNEVTRMNISSDLTGNDMVDGDTIERLLDEFDVSHAGTETVADRETHVLELSPANESGSGMATYEDAKIWVDSEYWYPLQYEVSLSLDNETTTVSMAYEEVSFNEGIPDERFQFEPPEDAEVTTNELSADITEVDDLAAADAETDFDVGEPVVPNRFTLSGVQIIESDDTASVTASFESDDGTLSYIASRDTNLPDGDAVQVGDSEGVYTETAGIGAAYVACDDVTHTVSSEDATEDELVDALAALECT